MGANSLPTRANRSEKEVAHLLQLGGGLQLQKSGILFTAKVSLGVWEYIGHQILSFSDSVNWWVADWLVYGESEFYDRYEEAIKKTSLSYQTLRNYTWVAREFPLPRRRDNLSFSHHAEVVALEQPEQNYWLRKAEELKWSRNKLRAEIRGSLKERKNDREEQSEENWGKSRKAEMSICESPLKAATGVSRAKHLHLALTVEEFAWYEETAMNVKQTVETWAVQTLRDAASKT